MVKNLPAMQEMQEAWVQSLGWEDPLHEGMATHYSILAWRIPCGSKSQADLHSQLIPWDEAETREVRNGVFLAISVNEDVTVISSSSPPGQPGRKTVPAIWQPLGCSHSLR